MINLIKKIVFIFAIFVSTYFLTSNSFAADETVEMLNKLDKESMVF